MHHFIKQVKNQDQIFELFNWHEPEKKSVSKNRKS